jgi:hypothetical protein
MTLAKEVPEALTDTMIAVAEAVVMVAEMVTVQAVTTMTAIGDTEEDVTATMTDLELTDTVADATTIVGETDVEVDTEAVTTTGVEIVVIVEETEMVDDAMVHHRQPNMVIQLLVRRLENLMVVGSLMTEASPVANTES